MILDAEADLTVVGEAATGFEAVEEAARLAPDVVLMDIRMPGLDGVEAGRRPQIQPVGATSGVPGAGVPRASRR